MKQPSAEARRKIIFLTLACIVLLIVAGLVTRDAQIALFIALLAQVIGVIVIAPWKN